MSNQIKEMLGKILRKVLPIFTIGLISLFIFNGCEKDEKGHLAPAGKNGPKYQLSTSSDTDSTDPEYLGQQHSKALDEIADHSDFPDSIDYADIYTTAKDYLKDSLAGNHFLSYSATKSAYQDFIADTAGDKEAYADLAVNYFVDHFKAQTSISSNAYSYWDAIADDYENFQSVSDLKSDLETVEDSVEHDSSLSNKNQELLLAQLAIAKHSIDYWDNVKNTASHNWHGPFTDSLTNAQQTDLMINLSLGSSLAYGMVFLDEHDSDYSLIDSHSAGIGQAAFHVGPATVATGDW